MKLVEKCRNLWGTLTEPHQRLIEELLTQPTVTSWENARHIVISPAPVLTLDMAVKRITSENTTEVVPSPFTVYRAIQYALKKHRHFLSRPATTNNAEVI